MTLATPPKTTPPTGNRLLRLLGDRRVGVKIGILAGVLLVSLGAVGMLSLSRMSQLDQGQANIYSGSVIPVSQLLQIRSDMATVRGNALLADISTDPARNTQLVAAIQAAVADVAKVFAPYAANPDPGQDTQFVQAFQADWAAYLKVQNDQLLPLASSNEAGSAEKFSQVYFAQAAAPSAAAIADLNNLVKYEVEVAARDAKTGKATYNSAVTTVLTVLGIALLLGLGLALVITRLTVRPLRAMGAVLARLAHGDLTGHVEVTSTDEIGIMAGQLNTAVGSLRASVNVMADTATALAAASEQASATSTQIAHAAEETSVQAATVSASTSEVSASISGVAAAAEEMSSAIQEIATNAAQASGVAQAAVSSAQATNLEIERLSTSSAEIGDVVKLITTIATQTNLLALNATIEAARAGDAGKGFAVVAGEVKDLAQQTAQATKDIGVRVLAIQTDSASAATAVRQVAAVIAEINDYQAVIAAAVEEQSATTAEMRRSLSEASGGVATIAENVNGVASAADITAQGVSENQETANELARLATELHATVRTFTI